MQSEFLEEMIKLIPFYVTENKKGWKQFNDEIIQPALKTAPLWEWQYQETYVFLVGYVMQRVELSSGMREKFYGACLVILLKMPEDEEQTEDQ